MFTRISKRLFLGLALCTLFQFSGCLNRGMAREFIIDGVQHVGFEWLLDSDSIFDLFAD